MKTDTIAAIATAMSDSGIGIIRVSGSHAIEIVDQIYQSKNGTKNLTQFQTHTIHYGFIADNGNILDEVMVSVMKAPNSYTAEDTVEINCHGGVLMMNRILETVLKYGARLAEPGEFTKRAFLNGRIDLSRAEAVIDIIHSKNEFALQSSVRQLRGSVSEKVKKLREEILYEIAFIESALDDPEHISLDGYTQKLEEKNENLISEIEMLLAAADTGKVLKEGINTVIVGKPNAGKSSLLNLLVGEEKAIVTNVAGTTRDVLEESIRLHGISLNMIDTAGIHSTEDTVEKIGVEKAKKYAADADLILYVVDSSMQLDENDKEILKLIDNKNVIILFNKSDLPSSITMDELISCMNEAEPNRYQIDKEKSTDIMETVTDTKSSDRNLCIIRTSTKENTGISVFEDTVKEMFFHGKIKMNDEIFITNLRHKEALCDACTSLKMVRKSLKDNMPEDFYSIDLMSAYASLGTIIGEEVGEDLVNEIFSKFCMGK